MPSRKSLNKAAKKRPGPLRRFWRGDVSLPLSFWGAGLGSSLALAFARRAVKARVHALLSGTDLLTINMENPDPAIVQAGWLGGGFFLFSLFCYAFLFTGIWRSAGNYEGPRLFRTLARASLIFGGFEILGDLAALGT